MAKDNTELRLEQIESTQKEILRRLDAQDRLLDLIYKDRSLMLENNENTSGAKQRVVDTMEHVENLVDKHTFETSKQIEEIKDIVENKGDEIKADIVKGIIKGSN